MLRHALAEILNRNEIRDPELDGVSVTITQVKPSPDMRYATVYCAPLGGGNAGPIIAALNRHKGFMRGQMGHMISIKFTPDLRFCRRPVLRRGGEDRKSSQITASPARSCFAARWRRNR
jgi:ribosome-binding factor A